MNFATHQMLQDLARRIEQMESARRRVPAEGAATGVAALDALLPPDGLARGAFMELIAAADGAGAWTLGIVMAAHVCPRRKALVIVDVDRQFYFPGAVRLGLELSRTILIRPASRCDAYQAIVQSLRSSVVGLVLSWEERLSMRQLRRLQLAAEAGGGVAILLRPLAALRSPSCAAVRLLVAPVANPRPVVWAASETGRGGAVALGRSAARESVLEKPWQRCVRVEVMRCRGRASGQSMILEIDNETGHVHAPAPVASRTTMARSARASG